MNVKKTKSSKKIVLKITMSMTLIRTHLGESANDPSCLDWHRTCLQHYKLDKKKPEYNQACELIEHSLITRLLDITQFETKFCPGTIH